MQINYFDCKYADCDERNFGSEDEPDYDWVYGCMHPKGSRHCNLDNKYGDEKDDCKLLNETHID